MMNGEYFKINFNSTSQELKLLEITEYSSCSHKHIEFKNMNTDKKIHIIKAFTSPFIQAGVESGEVIFA